MKIKNIVLSLIVCTASAQIFSEEQAVDNVEQAVQEQSVQPLVKKHVIVNATTETTQEANLEEVQASDVAAEEVVVTEEVAATEVVEQN